MINEVGGKVDFQQFSHVSWFQYLHLPYLSVCVRGNPWFQSAHDCSTHAISLPELMLKDVESV